MCRAEGFEALARVRVAYGSRSVNAVLNVITSDLISPGEAGLSEEAWSQLQAVEGARLHLSHPPVLESFGHVRGKMHGLRFDDESIGEIVHDIAAGDYSDLHLAAFLTACAGQRLDVGEMISLTRAMIAAGDRLTWGRAPVVDKHCVGGLPGNRTTPIIVAIVAASGLLIPKTSSRGITSPAGTADVMETLTDVDLPLSRLRKVVEQEGGCLAWGGAVCLSPVDDLLIRVEKALDVDGQGQLVASVLSKKAAAGATHALIDIPWGPTAKVRSAEAAASLARDLQEVGRAVGVAVSTAITDGSQPIGRGIGPALEARDVLRVLRGTTDAPPDLRDRALHLAGLVLELGGAARAGDGARSARACLDSGAAWRKLVAICEAQGRFSEPGTADHTRPVRATRAGVVTGFDNRSLARAAKLAGAPADALAGLELHVHVGDVVEVGQPLFTLHAESEGELSYASEYVERHAGIVAVDPEPR